MAKGNGRVNAAISTDELERRWSAVRAAMAEQRGSGWFLHNDPTDRPASSFAGVNTIHTGGRRDSYLLLPVIPE